MDIHNYISKFKDTRPIINNILKDVTNGKLIIRNFNMIDNRTLAQMRQYMVNHKVINAHANISNQTIINKAKKIWSGWCYNNIIYNNSEISKGYEMLNTVIHEYIHYYRKRADIFKYGTHNQVFIEEFFAYLVANYNVDCIKSNKKIPLTYEYIEQLSTKIIKKYELKIKNPELLIKHHIHEIHKFII
jgi:hypothetical protein